MNTEKDKSKNEKGQINNPLSELYFDLKMRGEQMDLASALSLERNIEKKFSEYIEYIAIQKKSLVFSVDGGVEGNRTLTGIAMMLLIINALNHIKKVKRELKISVDPTEMLHELRSMKKSNCYLQIKEIALDSKSEQFLTDLFLQLRLSQKFVGVSFPEHRLIQGVNLYLSIVEKDPDSIKIVIRYGNPLVEKDIPCLGWIKLIFSEAEKLCNKDHMEVHQ